MYWGLDWQKATVGRLARDYFKFSYSLGRWLIALSLFQDKIKEEIVSRWWSRRTRTQLLIKHCIEITTIMAVEQPLTGGCWNQPKKDAPRSKTEEKLPQDHRRGAITVRSNPIPTGWTTCKLENNNTKDVLPLLWRFWTPCQSPQPADPAKGLRLPKESDFESQWDLIARLPQDWGETETQDEI